MTDHPTVIIKKYSNRRLYNTQTSSYITLDDVRHMVRKDIDFEVRDAKTSEDLTRQILTQIIFEQELNGTQSILPVNFLKRMVAMYDNNMRDVFPHYLDGTMETFLANQEKIREQFTSLWEPYAYKPVEQLEAMQRKNMELVRTTMQMFNPFMAAKSREDDGGSGH